MWSASIAAIENHRCPTSLVGVQFVHEGPARNALVRCLRRCDEMVNTSENKSQLQALETTIDLVPSFVEI